MKILIFYPPNKLGMSDFRPTDYATLAQRARTELDGKIPNFGNKVWLQGIVSAISTEENTYEYGYDDLTPDYINNNFDCVLLPLANCFSVGWIKYLKKRTSYIEKLKIPVYVIACGVQVDSYDNLNNLVSELREPATKFINSVYSTGGEFALRGYFTEEFFHRLGFNDAVVTGCPSLYQMGRNLKLPNDKVNKDDFKATINGTFKLPVSYKDIKKAEFVCQDRFGKFLYDPEYIEKNPFTLRRVLKLVKRGDYDFVQALAENRIKLFADTQQWMRYYVQNDVKFSFGSRIHGSIMPILSGVPAMCYTMDARTREMVEFFDIPYIDKSQNPKKRDLYDWYMEADYSKFNMNFSERFDNYEAFLRKCGLVKNINQKNSFMAKENVVDMPFIVNQAPINELGKMIKHNKVVFNTMDLCYRK